MNFPKSTKIVLLSFLVLGLLSPSRLLAGAQEDRTLKFEVQLSPDVKVASTTGRLFCLLFRSRIRAIRCLR